ncbi:RNA-binding domain-containing protein [Adlercreutzia sp. R25]|uniref:RNA-binding domain-containing protein n=1 Tax=Adlercreutzia shanghongiae TaxID=3111773 RepID=UPI002DBC4AC8|nr:RNA-binding domain-containing protein [Adlercreutzia sp. R25]MEC4273323.1 RNA-binding domain-containing protein [Adlercreutzia sp. R25]
MMERSVFENILQQGESTTVEFKRCGSKPERDSLETLCSFANRNGGSLFLGVTDDGIVQGIPSQSILDVERNLINCTCNPKLVNMPPSLEFEQIEYDGRWVLRVWVPPTQGVFRFKGKVYDRFADADVVLRTDAQIASLYLRKYSVFTEQHIFPYLRIDDLEPGLIDKCRKMASARRPNHPWAEMDDFELLRSAQLYTRDIETGAEGLNRAAALLLGRREVVLSACPAYKTDAVFRDQQADRYDDRETVRDNLVTAYGALRDFCAKHLPDPFYLEGDRRVSVRDIVVREMVSNTLIHREFTSPFPAKLIIDETGLRTENASRAVFEGRLTLSDFNPIPKNPIIANFFTQIGYAEELGSGFRNLEKYAKALFGADPVLEEGDVFKARIPRGEDSHAKSKTGNSLKEGVRLAIIALLEERKSLTAGEVAAELRISSKTAAKYLKELVAEGLAEADGNVRTRRYYWAG